MQMKTAASVLPDPVGAEISVVLPARISGQPCSCGSVGEPNRPKNHPATSGCAHESDTGISVAGSMFRHSSPFSDFRQFFSPHPAAENSDSEKNPFSGSEWLVSSVPGCELS